MLVLRRVRTFLGSPRLAYFVAILGCLFFIAQLYRFAHTQTSLVDEGMYLYLGYKFVTGSISYTDTGLWNYYAPLSYLIPGVIQDWFGPGLRIARYFSIFLDLLTIVPLWLTAKRLRGNWWAALLIWAVALMPIQNRILGIGLSQPLVNCMVGWAIFFVLGEDRTFLQVITGAFISGIVVMTRQNMLPLLPLFIIYVFWVYGKRVGSLALLASLAPVIILHLLFWPNILGMWNVYWLFPKWLPFLTQYAPPTGSYAARDTVTVSSLAKLITLSWGFRAYYIPFLGVVASFLLWPAKRKNWKSEADFRASVFLGFLFLALLAIHLWASVITLHYGIFGYVSYGSFYSNIGLLLVMISYPSWAKNGSLFRTVIVIIAVLVVSFSVGLSTFEQFGDLLLNMNIPRIIQFVKMGIWHTGYPLWDILENRFALDYQSARLILPPVVSFVLGGILIAFLCLAKKYLQKHKILQGYGMGFTVLTVFLFAGFVISPLMGTAYRENGECATDMIRNYERIGATLRDIIPTGSNVYWNVDSAILLLYARDVSLHPAQVYGLYTFRYGGDTREIEDAGYWNEALASQWLAEADFIIIQENAVLSTFVSLEKDLSNCS